MSHYVVGYHDLQNNHYEICEYADDGTNAIKQAREEICLTCWQVLFLVNTVLRRINERLVQSNHLVLYLVLLFSHLSHYPDLHTYR